MQAATSIRVLVVDDHPGVLGVVGRLVASVGVFTLAGAAASVAEARTLCSSQRIELVLADVVMPDGGGPALARWLADQPSGPVVVLMSSYGRDELPVDTWDLPGVAGFVPKSELSPVRLLEVWRRATGSPTGERHDDANRA